MKVLVTADLSIIKERFARRMHGHLPATVELMPERNHGRFDGTAVDFRDDGGCGDAEALCAKILAGK